MNRLTMSPLSSDALQLLAPTNSDLRGYMQTWRAINAALPPVPWLDLGPEAGRTAADTYHAHLDDCEQCRNRPFEQCPIGQLLLTATGAGAADALASAVVATGDPLGTMIDAMNAARKREGKP